MAKPKKKEEAVVSSNDLFDGKYDYKRLMEIGFQFKLVVIDRGHLKIGFWKRICEPGCPKCSLVDENNLTEDTCEVPMKEREYLLMYPSYSIRRWSTANGLGGLAMNGPDDDTLFEKDLSPCEFFLMRQIYIQKANPEAWRQYFNKQLIKKVNES